MTGMGHSAGYHGEFLLLELWVAELSRSPHAPLEPHEKEPCLLAIP